jgi:tetratricopeptide (TPR) repeat protein
VKSLDRGDTDTANGYFKRAVRLDPENAAAHYHLGLVALTKETGRTQAITHFERAEQLQPDQVEVLYQLGRTLTEEARAKDGLATLERAIIIDPNHAGCWHYKGVAAEMIGHRELADTAWRESIAIAPERSRSYVSLGMMYESVQAYDSAEGVYQAALKYGAASPDILNVLGVLKLRFREVESAISLLDQALTRDGGRMDTVFNLAFAYAEAGKKREAVNHLNVFLSRADRLTYATSFRVAQALKETLLAEGI